MPLRSVQHADLSPTVAVEVGKHLVELAGQAEEGQVVRVHIVVGGAVGLDRPPWVVAELREAVEEQ